ncbi:MAG: hypothetical protein AAGJ54_10005 [Planctomycetota bacterium]
MKTAISALVIAAGTTASAQTLTAVAEDASNNNFATEVITVDLPYDGAAMLNTWAPGDMFGRINDPDGQLTTGGLPFAMVDESTSTFTTDTFGIIDRATDFGDFFGVVDTVNGSNGSGGSADYTWINTGAGTIVNSFSVDVAAMGDFEGTDLYNFSISTDGGATFPFSALASANEDIAQQYQVASGALSTLNDPMTFDGNALNNDFLTVTFSGLNLAVTGDIVLRFAGQSDGGTEAFAWRNASIEVIPAPASAALLGLGGLAAARRRR